jgi:protein-L-isoaspartate O-methyltransferase
VECVQPGLLARILTALNLEDTTRVLYAPTGSGYGVALIASRVGSNRVTTLEADPTVAGAARSALRDVGYLPTTRVTDNVTDGWPRGGPFDRIILAAAAPTVPAALIGQATDGGTLVTGLWRGTGSQPLVALTVTDDGTAQGHLICHDAHLLPLPGTRTAAPAPIGLSQAVDLVALAGGAGRTNIAPDGLTNPDFIGWATLQPGIHALRDHNPDILWYTSANSAVRVDSKVGTLTAYGLPHLDDLLVEVFVSWTLAGEPAADRLGITIADRETYWCDRPDQPLWTPPATPHA